MQDEKKPRVLYVNPEDFYGKLQLADEDTDPDYSRYVSYDAYTALLEVCRKMEQTLEQISNMGAFAGRPTPEQDAAMVRHTGLQAPQLARAALEAYRKVKV